MSDDQVAFFRATGRALSNLLAVQDRDRVQAIADAVLRRPRQGARSGDLGPCLMFLGYALLERGDRTAAEAVWEEMQGLAERTRDAGLRVQARLPGVALAFLDGRLDELRSLLGQVEALAAELGTTPIALPSLSQRRLAACKALSTAATIKRFSSSRGSQIRPVAPPLHWRPGALRSSAAMSRRGRCGNGSAT